MNRRINTEVGDSINKEIKYDSNQTQQNFTTSKRYFRLKSNASESNVELKRQYTINPIQQFVSIDQKKLYNMTKQSLQVQTEQLKQFQQQDFNIHKKSTYLNKNLDKLVHKIQVNKDQYLKRRDQLLKQFMSIQENYRSKSNYNFSIKDNEQIHTILQVRSILNFEDKVEQQQKRFQRQSQSDLKIRSRFTSYLEKLQERSQDRQNNNFSYFTIHRKELINKNNSQVKIKTQNFCNKEINTD